MLGGPPGGPPPETAPATCGYSHFPLRPPSPAAAPAAYCRPRRPPRLPPAAAHPPLVCPSPLRRPFPTAAPAPFSVNGFPPLRPTSLAMSPLLRWPWSPPAGGQVEGHLRCPRRCRFPWKPAAAPPPPPPPQPSAEVAPLLRRAPWPCHPSPPSLAVVAAGHPTCGYSSATGSARLGPSPRPPHWHTPHRRHRHRRSVDHLTPHGLEKIQQKTNTYNSYAANQAAHGAAHRSP